MTHLLDTSVISDLLHHPQGRVARRIAEIGESRVCTSVIVAAELRFGATKRNSSRLSAAVDGLLARLEVLPFRTPADIVYGDLRDRLERSGTPIGGNDLLIAAQAVSLELVIVTDNLSEFSRLEELQLENWLRA